MSSSTHKLSQYTFSLKHYNSFHLQYLKSSFLSLGKFATLAYMSIIFYFLSTNFNFSDFIPTYAIVGILMGAFLTFIAIPLLIYIIGVYKFYANSLGKKIHDIEISDTHVFASADGISSTIPWDKLHLVKTTKASILLFTSKNCALIAPKSAFTSTDAAESFASAAHALWTAAKTSAR